MKITKIQNKLLLLLTRDSLIQLILWSHLVEASLLDYVMTDERNKQLTLENCLWTEMWYNI